MDLKTRLSALKTKPVTVYVIGGEREFAGTLTDVGDGWLELDLGSGEPLTIVPFTAVSGVAHR